MRTEEGLERFRAQLEAEQHDRLRVQAPDAPFLLEETAKVSIGKRWVRVDYGSSGKYVVDTDGTIYGIKGYGVPHLRHRYGTLATIDEWDWSGYKAVRKGAA
jgi:hypothetical protein